MNSFSPLLGEGRGCIPRKGGHKPFQILHGIPFLMKTSLFILLPLLIPISAISAGYDAARTVNVGGERIFRAIGEKTQGNICISPYSIQTALGMTYAGAEGSTKVQMARALEFPENPDELASGFQKLDSMLKAATRDDNRGDSVLNVANRLFGASGFAFRPAFLELLKQKFLAPLEELDFKKDPSLATDVINRWVEKQTENRIRNLIPAGALTKATTLVLANALYLKIPWAEEFAASATSELPFHPAGREEVPVPTMTRTDSFGYLQIQGYTVVGIPFRDGKFQFVIFLPDKVDTSEFPAAALLEASARLHGEEVRLFLPKFKLEPPTISLSETLQSLGVKAAFDIPRGSANFDAMAPRLPDDYLYISDVFHKTFFALDEKGVEAAAATAVVVMRATGMPVRRDPIEVHVDRPFFFAIQHIPTSACLFLGKITDPR